MKQTKQYHIDLNYSEIDIKNIALEIGYNKDNIPDYIETDIQALINEFKGSGKLSGGYVIYDTIELYTSHIVINGIKLHTSSIISKALKRSKQIAVFACSAGEQTDLIIKTYKESEDPLKFYLADLAASHIAEHAAEYISKKLGHYADQNSMNITNRFSPGYCNWDVAEQKELFALLPNNFCGIHLNEYALMTPLKSVSGIIGIGEDVKEGNYYCSECTKSDCLFFKK